MVNQRRTGAQEEHGPVRGTDGTDGGGEGAGKAGPAGPSGLLGPDRPA